MVITHRVLLQHAGLASALLPLALPLALPMVLIGIFKVNPTIAATTGAMAAGKGSKKSNSQELRAILNSRFGSGGKMSILQKIFLGVNARGKLSNWKAGDTRTEISMLINGLSMCAILGVWAAGAYVVQKREEAAELRNMRREVVREKEYREVQCHTQNHAHAIECDYQNVQFVPS